MMSLLFVAAAAAQVPIRPPSPVTVPPSRQSQIGYLTARELADRCKDSTTAAVTYCYAYIAAVHDTMRAYEVWLNQREFCMPRSITQNELKERFLGYLIAYPSNESGLASSVVAVALKASAPCDTAVPGKSAPIPGPAS